jgi:hypothetical protein
MRTSIVLFVLIWAGSARAQPSLVPSAPPEDEQVTSYYRSTLAIDAASVGLFLAGAASEGPGGQDTKQSSTLMGMGLLGMSLGVPIVHAARGHWGRALGSLGLRSTIPMIGAAVAVSMTRCDDTKDAFCKLDYIGPGVVAGFVLAGLIDASFMTEERRPASTWAPQIAASRTGLQLGFAAAF